MKCDELKDYRISTRSDNVFHCYIKSEVDAAIAELKQKLEDAKATAYAESVDAGMENRRLKQELRHHKYKRCLAMAEWCEATALWSYQAANTLPVGFHATLYGKPVMIEPGRLIKRYVLLTKWHKRWLELAEKFKDKEAK